MDEKGYMMGQASTAKIIMSRKSGKVGKFVTQDGGREMITTIECVAASGKVLPPMIIHKGKSHLKYLHDKKVDENYKGWTYGFSDNGWTDAELGVEWLKRNFVKYSDSVPLGEYKMLILDGHSSHVSYRFIELCIENNIIALCLPAHSTHLLQPLDVGLFGPAQHYYGKAIDRLTRLSGISISKDIFLKTLPEVRKNAFTQKNVISAFRSTGIHPFCPEKVIAKLPLSLNSNLSDPTQEITQNTELNIPQTPKTSRQLSGLWSDFILKSSVTPKSTLKINKIFNCADFMLSENTVLKKTVEELREIAKQKRVRVQGDQGSLCKARVMDEDELMILKAKLNNKKIKPKKLVLTHQTPSVENLEQTQ